MANSSPKTREKAMRVAGTAALVMSAGLFAAQLTGAAQGAGATSAVPVAADGGAPAGAGAAATPSSSATTPPPQQSGSAPEQTDATAPETGTADVAATVVARADPLADALATRLSGKASWHPRVSRKEQEAIAAFYAIGGYQPLWIKDGTWTSAAQTVMQRLKHAGEEGLDPADYPVPALAVATRDEPAALAEAEIKLSAAAVAYARDARGARIEPARLSNLITPTLELPAADAILTALAAAQDAGAALAAYNPPHAGYRALKQKLAQLRAGPAASAATQVPEGPALKVGMRDARVPPIRARFGVKASGDDTVYDENVASAVKDFQRQKRLPTTGVFDRRTSAALAGPSAVATEDDVIANMERWRWLPSDLGRRYVWVNVPEFKLRLMAEGRPVHEARVIVGKPETPTPLFSDEMDHAIVNPSWYMPSSIFKNEFNSDPAYAAARGYEVRWGRDGGITVRQPPGERNALGFVKFMFPNRHAVYLHDTPNRNLFSADKRAFSHGCVRLDQPFRFGEFVLGPQWTEARLKSLIGRGERTIPLPEKIPVHLTYFTLLIDDKGAAHRMADLYGVNNKVRVALGLARDAAAVAEAPRPRLAQQAQAQAQAPRKRVRPAHAVVQARPYMYPQPLWWFTR